MTNRITEMLRFMRPGDVIFLPYRTGLDRDIHSRARSIGLKVTVSRWIGVKGTEGEAQATCLLRIELPAKA